MSKNKKRFDSLVIGQQYSGPVQLKVNIVQDIVDINIYIGCYGAFLNIIVKPFKKYSLFFSK